MKALIQRVKNASVEVKGSVIGRINKGIVVFLGIKKGDTIKDIDYLVNKIVNLRIFEGKDEKLDLSLEDIKGEMLIISQFTLYGSCKKGRRPDFTESEDAEKAKEIYRIAIDSFKKTGLKVEEGEFQAMMDVKLINDGPFTLILEGK
jgi:D-tyrosyl-tRNA(Tyr) deacylase